MSQPVIFLAFANDRDDYLPLINRERKNISRSMRRHADKGMIKLIAEASSTLEDIFEMFSSYDNEIVIFHYGGHAGGTELRLEQTDASSRSAHARGLAQLLGQQEALRLVFLNGCATKEQVQLLLDSGVRAVVATSVPIQDQMATEFAEQFYNTLANHSSIQRSFNIATAFISAKYGDDFPPIEIYRSIRLKETGASAEFPWGLYIKEGDESSFNWKLPKTKSRVHLIRNRYDYESRVDVNDVLIDVICDEIAKYNPDLDYELNKEDFDIPSIKREIVDSFPTPIGEQLRKLFTRSNNPDEPDDMERFTLARLEQLALAYRSTVQFICFTVLSQLWDVLYKNPQIKIKEDYIVDFNSFFAQSPDTYKSFDYVKMIRSITDIFDDLRIPYFIDELKDVKIDTDLNRELYEAYIFMNAIFEDILDGDVNEDTENLEDLCLEAEQHLGIILRELAFLVKYKLATIKNIELIKNRHEPARFRHIKVMLNQALTVASTGITEVGIEFENYTDNRCVLFLKTIDNEIKDYLSLTPFVIDENALNSDYSTKLYLYAYQDGEDYCFEFLNNSKDPPLHINREIYPDIKEQFEKFKAEIFNQEYQPAKQEEKQSRVGGGRFLSKKKKR